MSDLIGVNYKLKCDVCGSTDISVYSETTSNDPVSMRDWSKGIQPGSIKTVIVAACNQCGNKEEREE